MVKRKAEWFEYVKPKNKVQISEYTEACERSFKISHGAPPATGLVTEIASRHHIETRLVFRYCIVGRNQMAKCMCNELFSPGEKNLVDYIPFVYNKSVLLCDACISGL